MGGGECFGAEAFAVAITLKNDCSGSAREHKSDFDS